MKPSHLIQCLVAGLALLVSPTLVQADCMPCADMPEHDAGVWPQSGTTPVGTVFVLQQMNSSATGPIADLAARNPRLETEAGDAITLSVGDHFEGECAIAAVTLTPESPPEVGQTYSLRYDAPDGTPVSALIAGRGDIHGGWLITDDHPAPPGPVQAQQTGSDSIPYGCGPSNHIIIGSTLDDTTPTPTAVRIERTPATSEDSTGFLLFPNADGVLYFGHSMCQGAFRLDGTSDFDVTLTAVDAVGQVGPTETLRLSWP